MNSTSKVPDFYYNVATTTVITCRRNKDIFELYIPGNKRKDERVVVSKKKPFCYSMRIWRIIAKVPVCYVFIIQVKKRACDLT